MASDDDEKDLFGRGKNIIMNFDMEEPNEDIPRQDSIVRDKLESDQQMAYEFDLSKVIYNNI